MSGETVYFLNHCVMHVVLKKVCLMFIKNTAIEARQHLYKELYGFTNKLETVSASLK